MPTCHVQQTDGSRCEPGLSTGGNSRYGAAGAVNILYRKSTPEEKQEIIKDYEDKFSNPYCAAERGLIDEVIMPRDTRYKLIQALEMCHNKNQSNPPKKHGNMPL